MRAIILMFCVIIISACSKRSYPKFDYNNGPNPWINAFKDKVFFNAIREGYKSDTIFNLIAKKDAFNPYDGLGAEALKKARELAHELIRKMPPPSLCDDCKKGMNFFMAQALHYYKSRDLELIAQAEYKKHLKDLRAWKKDN